MKSFLAAVILFCVGNSVAGFAGYLPPDYGQPCHLYDGHTGRVDERGYCRHK